jgi:hypothetical protein
MGPQPAGWYTAQQKLNGCVGIVGGGAHASLNLGAIEPHCNDVINLGLRISRGRRRKRNIPLHLSGWDTAQQKLNGCVRIVGGGAHASLNLSAIEPHCNNVINLGLRICRDVGCGGGRGKGRAHWRKRISNLWDKYAEIGDSMANFASIKIIN